MGKEQQFQVCEVCSNQGEQTFKLILGTNMVHVFDTFECAIHALAPICDHCGCRILGHGIEQPSHFYCCEGCAAQSKNS